MLLWAGAPDLPLTHQPGPETGHSINPFSTLSTRGLFLAWPAGCPVHRLSKCLAQWALACLAGDREGWPALGLVPTWLLWTCVI